MSWFEILSLLIGGVQAGASVMAVRGTATRPPLSRRTWGSIALVSALTVVSWTGYAFLARATANHVTVDNVGAFVRRWLDHFHFSTRPESGSADAHFALIAEGKNGRHFVVVRPKDEDQYVLIQAALSISPEQMNAFKSLSPGNLERLKRRIILELAGLGVSYTVSSDPSVFVTVTSRVPITAALDEATFMMGLSKAESGLNVAQISVLDWLDEHLAVDGTEK